MDITHVTLSLAKSTKTSKISTFIQNNHIWLAYCTVTGTYIKLYVILNEFLIKLSSQKITECVALQWSQNQLDHRFTKKITVELSVVSLWRIWWGGVKVYGEVIHIGRDGPTGQWIYQSYSSPTLWPPWALWWHSKRTTDNIWEIVNTCIC